MQLRPGSTVVAFHVADVPYGTVGQVQAVMSGTVAVHWAAGWESWVPAADIGLAGREGRFGTVPVPEVLA